MAYLNEKEPKALPRLEILIYCILKRFALKIVGSVCAFHDTKGIHSPRTSDIRGYRSFVQSQSDLH